MGVIINALGVQYFSTVIMTMLDIRRVQGNYVEIRFNMVGVGLARGSRHSQTREYGR